MQYFQVFLMELKDANCTEWKQDQSLVESFALFLVTSINDNPSCNGLCRVTTDHVDIALRCGSVILSITLNVNRTSVPTGVDANDLVEYFIGDVINSLNKSSDGSPVLVLGDQVFNLGTICGPTTSCRLIQTENPTEPITTSGLMTQTASRLNAQLTSRPSTGRSTATSGRPIPVATTGIPSEHGGKKLKTSTIAIIVVVSVAGIMLLLILAWWVYKRRQRNKYRLHRREAKDFWGTILGGKQAEEMRHEEESEYYGKPSEL
jgi:hypothetical protein